jgi:hypothetical protein
MRIVLLLYALLVAASLLAAGLLWRWLNRGDDE